MTPQDFLTLAIPAAQAAQAATGIPTSITVAQAFLETGYGNHMPPGSNNPFGIKANALQIANGQFVSSMTTEVVNGVLQHVSQRFAKYASWADAFTARSQMILSRPWFAQALKFNNDPQAFIVALQSGMTSTGQHMPYSTNPDYASVIMHIVNQYGLTKYDSTDVVTA